MPMNPRILRPLARPLLLDAVPGAAAAYSLRQLSNSYTGPVVTVRRSSDDAEADFKASEIDDGTLAAFCGAGDGFVKTWFDQSGNTGRDASQGTAASQPKIVDSGSLVTEGGKPALEFDGSDDGIFYAGTGLVSLQYSVFSVFANQDTGTSVKMLVEVNDGASDGCVSVTLNDGLVGSVDSGAWYPGVSDDVFVERVTGVSAATQNVTSTLADFIADGKFFVNSVRGAAFAGGRRTASQNGITIGFQSQSAPVRFFDGTISELIIYPSDQSANRERIEGDLAWYY